MNENYKDQQSYHTGTSFLPNAAMQAYKSRAYREEDAGVTFSSSVARCTKIRPYWLTKHRSTTNCCMPAYVFFPRKFTEFNVCAACQQRDIVALYKARSSLRRLDRRRRRVCESSQLRTNGSIMVGPAAGEKRQLVCVTGAGGFIGSWLVRELLQRGYAVRGTARDPEDRKNAHLHALDGAGERLSLCRADVVDYRSLRAAFSSCDGVFHVASPVSDDDPEVVSAAVQGTKNVINAAADMGVKRVVFTSSYGAVHMNPNRSPDQTLDETCWSDLDFCKQTKNLYCYAKTVAEKTATEEASKRGVQLVVLVPSLTIGEMLQPALNLSNLLVVASYMKGRNKYPNAVAAYVDVHDVARAHVLVYENPAANGRYLCIGDLLHRSDLLQMLRELFPQYPITTRCADDKPKVKPYKFSTQRLQDLGMKFTPLKESLRKTVISLQEKGHLPILPLKSAI